MNTIESLYDAYIRSDAADYGVSFESVLRRYWDAAKCGKGWVGMKGKCKRAKAVKAMSTADKKAWASEMKSTNSKAERQKLANQIRKERGMKAVGTVNRSKAKAAKPDTPPAVDQHKPSETIPPRGGALALRGGQLATQSKTAGGKGKGGNGKGRTVEDIADKYASENPSDADVRAFMKETAEAIVDPSPENIQNRTVKELMRTAKIDVGTIPESDREKFGINPDKVVDADSFADYRVAMRKYKQESKRRRTGKSTYTPEDYVFPSHKVRSEADLKKELEQIEAKRAKSKAKNRDKVAKNAQRKAQEELELWNAAVRNAERDNRDPESLRDDFKAGFARAEQEQLAKIKKEAKKVANGQYGSVLIDNVRGIAQEMPMEESAFKRNRIETEAQNAAGYYLQNRYKEGGAPIRALGLKMGQKPSRDELKRAYRKAAVENHPDRGGSQEDFVKINQAYETLKQRYGFDSLDISHRVMMDAVRRYQEMKRNRVYR